MTTTPAQRTDSIKVLTGLLGAAKRRRDIYVSNALEAAIAALAATAPAGAGTALAVNTSFRRASCWQCPPGGQCASCLSADEQTMARLQGSEAQP